MSMGMEEDRFYEKLNKLNQSSCLNPLFNFQGTFLDLHLLYKEVTERGGFNQVTKDRKWDEVAHALNLKSNTSMSPNQLRGVCENLLHRYEQTYYYRTPGKTFLGHGPTGLKRKHCEITSLPFAAFTVECNSPTEKKKCSLNSCQVSTGPPTPEQKQTSKYKKPKKDRDAPLRCRTAYQMYLKIECDRLKKTYGNHGNNSGNINIRDMAVDGWNKLAESDKQPYVEASKKDRDRFLREMADYTQHKQEEDAVSPSMINFGASSKTETDGDYYVTSFEPRSVEMSLPDKSLVESTVQMMKNASPSDPIFHINLDACAELPGIPTEGYV